MGERILLVEGEDDRHVLWNLFQVRGIPERFEVRRSGSKIQPAPDKSAGGDSVLLTSLKAWLDRSELECLAIVLDSNGKGPSARWQSVRQRLINAGCDAAEIPEHHDENGTVVEVSLEADTPRSIRFSAWFMPDNRSLGMIEDFVIGLIRAGDVMLPRVDAFLHSLPAAECRFSPAHLPKARVHTWLAISEAPGRPMGQAVAWDKCIDVQHPSVQPFLNWIHAALVQ